MTPDKYDYENSGILLSEARTIYRVLARIQEIAAREFASPESSRSKDGLAMYKILGQLELRCFGYAAQELGE